MSALLHQLLDAVEAELRNLQQWRDTAPSAEALASTAPFCVDTLSFPEWLQFVFLPRMRWLLEHALPLPGQCGIAPMAEEYFRHPGNNSRLLIGLLQQIDEGLAGHEH